MNEIRAVIFDMDGTMVNTEIRWAEVNHALSQNHGVTWEDIARRKMMGKKDSEALAVFKEFYKLDTPVDELVKERRTILLSDLSSIQVNAGLLEFLDLLDRLHIPKAVATASSTEFTEKILSRFDLIRRFDVIVTGDQVTHSKPDPELFLSAAKRLDVESEHCLVLEDAQNGIEAAHNAGMRSIALPHRHSQTHDFSKATRILQTRGCHHARIPANQNKKKRGQGSGERRVREAREIKSSGSGRKKFEFGSIEPPV